MNIPVLNRKALLSVLAIAVVAVSGSLLNISNDARAIVNGTMYFSPQTVMASGSTWSVQIRVNSQGQAVNAVASNFTYPTGVLTFSSINAAGSAFNIDASSTGGSGMVSVTRGASGTAPSGDLLVATVNFAVVGSGAAALNFQSGSLLFESAGSTDILSTKTNGSYNSLTGPLKTVHRMANYLTKERLFTIDANERDYAVAHYAGWHFDGVAFFTAP